MRAYREILSLPGAWQFSAAGLLARSGGAMMGLGMVLMVSALYGSYGLAGALAASNAVAWALGTATLSNLVDRYGQRRVMYPAVIVAASSLALLVVFAMLQLPAWTLFPPAIVSGATGGAPGALVRARWNHATNDPDHLHTAYALESTLDEVTFVVGPVLATALSTGVHPAAGLIAPVVLSLVGAHLLYSQRATEPPVLPRTYTDGVKPPLRQRLVLLVPGVAAVVSVNLLIGCVFGSIDVSVVAAATEWDVRAASGVVLAVFSLASGLAGFYYGARGWGSPLVSRFLWGVAAMFGASLLLLAANSVLLLSVAGVLVGVTIAPTLINGNSLIGTPGDPRPAHRRTGVDGHRHRYRGGHRLQHLGPGDRRRRLPRRVHGGGRLRRPCRRHRAGRTRRARSRRPRTQHGRRVRALKQDASG